jgi:hypothetical protein
LFPESLGPVIGLAILVCENTDDAVKGAGDFVVGLIVTFEIDVGSCGRTLSPFFETDEGGLDCGPNTSEKEASGRRVFEPSDTRLDAVVEERFRPDEEGTGIKVGVAGRDAGVEIELVVAVLMLVADILD